MPTDKTLSEVEDSPISHCKHCRSE